MPVYVLPALMYAVVYVLHCCMELCTCSQHCCMGVVYALPALLLCVFVSLSPCHMCCARVVTMPQIPLPYRTTVTDQPTCKCVFLLSKNDIKCIIKQTNFKNTFTMQLIFLEKANFKMKTRVFVLLSPPHAACCFMCWCCSLASCMSRPGG